MIVDDRLIPTPAQTLDRRPTGLAPAATRPAGELPRAPRPPREVKPPKWRPLAKRALIVAAAVFGVYLVVSTLVEDLIHEQRQQHLAASMNAPTPMVESGDAVALIQVPSLGVNQVVIEGVSVDHLRGGPARVTGSALPGDAGVMVIWGHRTGYGAPFERIGDIAIGESVVVQARNNGPIVRYILSEVRPNSSVSDLQLDKTDVIAYLVLVTSDSKLSGDDQLIAVARALPVTDTSSADAALVTPTGDAPFGVETLLTLGSIAALCLAWRFLRHRSSLAIRIGALLPVAAYATIRAIMLLDVILPLAR